MTHHSTLTVEYLAAILAKQGILSQDQLTTLQAQARQRLGVPSVGPAIGLCRQTSWGWF